VSVKWDNGTVEDCVFTGDEGCVYVCVCVRMRACVHIGTVEDCVFTGDEGCVYVCVCVSF